MNKALFSGLSLSALLLAAPALADEPRVATMSLQASGTVKSAPDMATVSTGVVTAAPTAREALDANNAAMTKLLDLVKSSNVADKDMQTSGFMVEPQYVYSDKADANGYSLPPKIVGYQVSNTLTVTLRDLANLGIVLDSMVSAGSNTIGGVSFGVTDNEKLTDDARRVAMKNALAKADLYAKAADVCPARIVSISENGGFTPPQPQMLREMAYASDAAKSVPVAGGEVGYEMTVSVEWELTPGVCN